MKKIHLSLFIIVLSTFVYGQFPVNPSPTGSVQTLQRNNGAYEVGRGIVITNFPDTTSANNVSYMKEKPYIEIRTSDNRMWRRNASATQWIQLGSSGGVGVFVDSVTVLGDSLLYWKAGVSVFVTNIAEAAAGGDTTVFEVILDSTGQPNNRLLFSQNNKIASSPFFLADPVNRKIVIGNSNISTDGTATKLSVTGATRLNGSLRVSGPVTATGLNEDVGTKTLRYNPVNGNITFTDTSTATVAADTTVTTFPLYVVQTVGQKDSLKIYGVDSSYQNGVIVGSTLTLYRFNGDSTVLSIPSGISGGISSLGNGYGLTNVNDSTYAVDTSLIGSKSYIDAKDALKLNIADTSAMLNPYALQASVTSALGLKLNISDTASMLSPYAHTAAVTSALLLKLNISDTAAMLAGYLRNNQQWIANGNDIHYNTGKVGIGTTTPTAALTVSGLGTSDSTGILLTTNDVATSSVNMKNSTYNVYRASAWNTSSGSFFQRIRTLAVAKGATGVATHPDYVLQTSADDGATYSTFATFATGPASPSLTIGGSSITTNTIATSFLVQGARLQAGISGLWSFNDWSYASGTNAPSPQNIFNAGLFGAGGTNTVINLSIQGTINRTGGTSTYYGVRYNPTITSLTGTTLVAFSNVRGQNRLNETEGSTVIGGTTPAASAKFEVQSTTLGSIPMPSMTTTERNAIVSPANGLQVYDNTLNIPMYYNGSGWQGGGFTLGAIGSTANANGATLSGGLLTLQPASVSFGGVVTTGAQTFVGLKTFNSGLSAVNVRATTNLFSDAGAKIGVGATSSAVNGQLILHATQPFISFLRSENVIPVAIGSETTTGNLLIKTGGTSTTSFGGTTRLSLINSTGNLLLGTTTDVESSILTLESTTKGSLAAPRMTKAERNAIASPAAGLLVIVTGESGGEYLSIYNLNLTQWEKVNTTAD